MTRTRQRVMLCTLVTFLVVSAIGESNAQIHYDRGQNVAPVFEGWERNPDGTYDMVFGYMNRNYQEMPDVPVGLNNAFEPGPIDRGQPTRFYTRRQQFVFRVQVPADWGEKDLIWTLTANGRTDQAFGSLWPNWEIDEGVIKANRGMGANGAPPDNQPPSITLPGGGTLSVTRPNPLTITVVISDDGIPGPRPRREPAADNDDPQAAARAAAAQERRRRQPHPTRQAVVNARVAGETGLGLTWVHYRGPGNASFAPASASVEGGRGGEIQTSVTFTESGTHVVRAYADDSIITTPLDITVEVN